MKPIVVSQQAPSDTHTSPVRPATLAGTLFRGRRPTKAMNPRFRARERGFLPAPMMRRPIWTSRPANPHWRYRQPRFSWSTLRLAAAGGAGGLKASDLVETGSIPVGISPVTDSPADAGGAT